MSNHTEAAVRTRVDFPPTQAASNPKPSPETKKANIGVLGVGARCRNPTAFGPLVDTVSTLLMGLLPNVIVAGTKLHVAKEGRPEQANEMEPARGSQGLKVIVWFAD